MDLRIAADPPPAAEEGARATASPQGSLDQVSVLGRARRATLEKLGTPSAQAPSVGQSGQAGYADVLAARPAPSPAIRLTDARIAPTRTLGYAPAPAPVALAASSAVTTSSAAKTSASSSTSASAASKSDFAFLSDKKLSIQDKLFQFMLVVQKKEDQQLQKKMKQYADKYEAKTTTTSSSTAKASTTKASSSGGLAGLLEDVVGGALSILGLGGGGSPLSVLGDLAAELGGTVLGAAVTAIGLPALAPIAVSVGNTLGGAVKQAIDGSSSSSSSASSTSGKTSGTTTSTTKTSAAKTTTTPASAPSSIDAGDERLDMLEIQRMVEKQNQMFQLISNVLDGMNDTAMNVIANVR
jgi:hypothetical protein